jgi:UDP-N-acetylglucosamine 2-epimerase (non-hydrolysing)
MKVLFVVGARPNFMKAAPILAALEAVDIEFVLVHTGQHYDASMSDNFFSDLGLPKPDFHLGIGSGTHTEQTARVMLAFEPVLREVRPDWVVVVGDVNSTLACSLVVSKLKEELGCRLAHVEAGLRSHDWRMPEEMNRVLTDRMADLLLLPSRDAEENLQREGIDSGRIKFVGNVMIDTLLRQLSSARARGGPARLGLAANQYVLSTLHRPTNVDQPETLGPILEGLALIAMRMPVVLPLHPRTRRNAQSFGFEELLGRLQVLEPLGYTDMLALTADAAVVLTDSGGLQEETTALGIPCLTLREQTERPVTITEGTNRLADWPLSPEGILRGFTEALGGAGTTRRPCLVEGWDGKASQRIAAALLA